MWPCLHQSQSFSNNIISTNASGHSMHYEDLCMISLESKGPLTNYVITISLNFKSILGLFVVVSWISFVVPPDVIPGRMALLITLFLVLVNIFNTVTTNTPKAEGLTAIETWMLSCLLFVFGALVGKFWYHYDTNGLKIFSEYACILFNKQKGAKKVQQKQKTQNQKV